MEYSKHIGMNIRWDLLTSGKNFAYAGAFLVFASYAASLGYMLSSALVEYSEHSSPLLLLPFVLLSLFVLAPACHVIGAFSFWGKEPAMEGKASRRLKMLRIIIITGYVLNFIGVSGFLIAGYFARTM